MTSWIKTAYQRRFFLPTAHSALVNIPLTRQDVPLEQRYEVKEDAPVAPLEQRYEVKEDAPVAPLEQRDASLEQRDAPLEQRDEAKKDPPVAPLEQRDAPLEQRDEVKEDAPVAVIEQRDEVNDDILISDEVTFQDVIFEQNVEQENEPLTQEENISPLITFIVPTINRVTLGRTLASIQQQTVEHWKAIVIFDGCEANEIVTDERIYYMSIPKTGSKHKKRNTAGHVRNHGMRLVDTPWIGFVDDDDAITPKYVEHLVKELEMTPTADLILFRMVDNDQIIPSAACSEIKQSQVGISFVMKTDLVKEGFLFVQSSVEDYTIVKKIEASNKKIVLSPHICYLVRDSECEEESVTMHYVIN
jgi:hypothetical protein